MIKGFPVDLHVKCYHSVINDGKNQNSKTLS